MAHRIWTKSHYFFAAVVSFSVLFLLAASLPAYADAAHTSSLLQQAKDSAAQLARDSVEMESYTRSRVSWESHAAQINVINNHVNNSVKILADLHEAHEASEPWQQSAIDRITPLLQELASNTESIIEHLNDKQQTWHPEYQGYLKSNAELATDLSKLIADYIDYGNARARTEKAGRALGFSRF